jgi:hypothetical protein
VTGVFAKWQPVYAERGIATFPCGPDKIPAVRNYDKFGVRASTKIVARFADANALGFMCGKRSGILVGDVDEVGDKALQRFIDRHGDTPIVAQTASGKHHCWYRFNGEKRVIRPEPGVEVDVLGGGYVVAPPSQARSGEYQFISGGLDDLDRLPTMRNVPAKALPNSSVEIPPNTPEIAPEGTRDEALWRACMEALADTRVRTFEELIAFAREYNGKVCSPPQPDEDVMHAAQSAWSYEQRGENWFRKPTARITQWEILPFMCDPEVGMLYLWARASFKPDAEFWLADGLAANFDWSLYQLREARRRAVNSGLFRRIRGATTGNPALYVFGKPKRGSRSDMRNP